MSLYYDASGVCARAPCLQQNETGCADFVRKKTGLDSPWTQWSDWHEVLTQNDCAFANHLDEIQRKAELPHKISTLRAMDVIVWMHGTGGAPQPPTGVHEAV